MLIKRIKTDNYPKALSLVLAVFLQYEAPDYPEQGTQAFKAAISNRAYLNSLEMWGAYCDKKIVGVIALRDQGRHIALLFVDGAYHRKGIGRALFKTAHKNSGSDMMTVNSSPYAVAFYRALGFVPNGPEQITDGIRFTPMTYTKNNGMTRHRETPCGGSPRQNSPPNCFGPPPALLNHKRTLGVPPQTLQAF